MGIKRDFPDLPPLWALGTAAVAVGFGRLVPLWSLPAACFPLGAVLVALGVGVMGWAALWFRRKRTSIEPREQPTRLIVEGPFRINRNPIYSGMALAVLGVAMMAGTLSGLVLALVFPAIVTSRFIRQEEESLRTHFGADADHYIARTRRW